MYQVKMSKVLKKTNCLTANKLLTDEYTLDLCSFYIANIGELTRKLTDSTKEALSSIHCHSLLRIRNIIDHAYTSADKSKFIPFIFLLAKDESIRIVSERFEYCNKYKRKKS